MSQSCSRLCELSPVDKPFAQKLQAGCRALRCRRGRGRGRIGPACARDGPLSRRTARPVTRSHRARSSPRRPLPPVLRWPERSRGSRDYPRGAHCASWLTVRGDVSFIPCQPGYNSRRTSRCPMTTQIAWSGPLACDEESSMARGHRRRLDGGAANPEATGPGNLH